MGNGDSNAPAIDFSKYAESGTPAIDFSKYTGGGAGPSGDRSSPAYWDALKDKYGLPHSVDLSKTYFQNLNSLPDADIKNLDALKFSKAYAEANPAPPTPTGFFSRMGDEAKNIYRGMFGDSALLGDPTKTQSVAGFTPPQNPLPAIQARAQEMREHPAAGAGALTTDVAAAALPFVADKMLDLGGNVIGKTGLVNEDAADLMTRAIKPGKNNSGWTADIQSALPNMKQAEAQLGHPVQNIDDALQAAAIAKKNLWARYQTKLGAANSATIDGNEIADAMVNSVDKRTALQNLGLVQRIKAVADTYRREIPVAEGEDFLQSVNRDLHNYYAKNKVGRYVAQNDPEMASTVAEGDALRESLYNKLDEVTGPGAKDLKAKYGAISNVENEMMGRKNVSARQQPQSLSQQMGTLYGYGRIVKGLATGSAGDVLEGIADKAAANWIKDRYTTDSMIQRAFRNAETATPAAAPSAPTQLPSRLLNLITLRGISNASERQAANQ